MQNVGKVVWCLHYFLHHHLLQNMEKMVWCALACLLDNLCHASASIAKKMEKKLMRACLHHILCQKLSVRDAVYVETNLESNSGNQAPPFWSGRYIIKMIQENVPINQSINVYSFHQPYLIFQEKKAYSVATLYPNISKVTDYYISVEKISNRNGLEEELLEVLPKAKGAVASNVEGVEPGSC